MIHFPKESAKRDWWKAANLVSTVRLLVAWVPAYLALSAPDDVSQRWWAVTVFMLVAVTDALDGFIARRFNQITEWGKFLDPLVDKLLVLCACVALLVLYRPYPQEFAFLAVTLAIMLLREVILAWQIWRKGKEIVSSTFAGKLKMMMQCIMIVIWMMPLGDEWRGARITVLLFALAITVYSWVSYYDQFVKSHERPRYRRD